MKPPGKLGVGSFNINYGNFYTWGLNEAIMRYRNYQASHVDDWNFSRFTGEWL